MHEALSKRKKIFRFGDFEADELRFELRRCGRTVRVQRMVLHTIFHLLRNRGRLLSKQDLAQGPWKGSTVGEGAIGRAVMLARRAIADEGGTSIVTVHGLGYRFVPEVSEFDAPSVEQRESGSPCPLDEGPPIAPFLRAGELARLLAAYSRTSTGRGRVVVLAGEEGMGKTVLVEVFAHELERRGALVSWGRSCQARSGRAPVLWPWLEIVRLCISQLDELEGCRSLTERCHELVACLSSSGDEERPRVFDLVIQFLGELSRVRPLVVMLEDVQETDEASLLLLEFLRRRIRELSLMVVATRRPSAFARAIESPFDELGMHVQTIWLEALSTNDVRLFLESLGYAGPGAHAPAFRDATAGNPLLIRELAAAATFQGFTCDRDVWTDQPVPTRVARILRRRFLHAPDRDPSDPGAGCAGGIPLFAGHDRWPAPHPRGQLGADRPGAGFLFPDGRS